MDFTQLVQSDRRSVWHPFTQEATAPDPVPIVRAAGANLYTADGRVLLDLISSWWVTIHGHAHPAIAAAIAHQAVTLEQVIFAGFTHPPAVELAVRLTEKLPEGLSRVFFSDNGSTAVEVALKIAVQYWRNQGEVRTRFLSFEGGYHGDTVGAMSAGRSCGFFEVFSSLLFPVEPIPFPATWEGDEEVVRKEEESLALLDRKLADSPGMFAALIAEPLVQGAAGMRLCRPEFLQKLAERLRRANVLLIFDEVMTGFGRTGTLFACEQAGVTPDIICLSKGLTGGFLPLSVTVSQERIYRAFLGEGFDRALLHGHSFTANPLGCAAALASLALFEREETLKKVAEIETIHRMRLSALAGHPRMSRPRVLGTIAALDLVTDDPGYFSILGPWLKTFFLERGLLIRPMGHVLYLIPPSCIPPEDLHRAWDGVARALEEAPVGKKE